MMGGEVRAGTYASMDLGCLADGGVEVTGGIIGMEVTRRPGTTITGIMDITHTTVADITRTTVADITHITVADITHITVADITHITVADITGTAADNGDSSTRLA